MEDNIFYTLEPTETGYSFCTDSHYRYQIYLVEFEGTLFGPEIDSNTFIFGFQVIPNTNTKRKFDPKIAATICLAVNEIFLRDESIVLIFACELGENNKKGRYRKITFCKWHNEYLKDVIKHNRNTEDLYMSCMCHKNNPYREIIDSEVDNLQMVGKE